MPTRRSTFATIGTRRMALAIVLSTPLAVSVSGCAKNGAGPHAKALPAGSTCRSIHKELRKMNAAGVPSKVEAVSAGRKVSKKGRKQAARYNQLLNDYLSARCHTSNQP